MKAKAALIGAMMIGTAVLTPGIAQAALSECPTNYTCLWGNNDFLWYLTGKNQNNGYSNLSGEANNQMDSWANRSASYNSCGTGSANGGGDKQNWSRGTSDNNVSPVNSDEVSSYKTNGSC